MRIIAYELKKIFYMPALWVFVLLCVAFDFLLLSGQGHERDYFYMVRYAAEQGSIDAGPNDNVFEGYDTGNLAAFYADIVKDSPLAVRWMERKYECLQPRALHLAECGAALDFYAGDATYETHQFLFGSLMRAVLAQSCICAIFVVLCLTGYEQTNRTEGQVCTSRIGRALWVKKLAAAIGAALTIYAMLAGFTLALYFEMWDYGGVWSDSVSSRFNYLTDMLYARPFLTWHDFTVGGYLAAVLALDAALVTVFALLAAVCALTIRNVYSAALVIAVVLFGGMGLGSLLSQWKAWALYFAMTLQPTAVWMSVNVWFTESGISTFLPWQETLSVAFHLVAYGFAARASLRRFMCKDI